MFLYRSNIVHCIFMPAILLVSFVFGKQYRNDYVYNRKTDAFYKLHIEAVSLDYAKSICNSEGGSIMLPTSELDIEQAHIMLKKYPDIGNIAWIGNDGKVHESVEIINIFDGSRDDRNENSPGFRGVRQCDVVTRDGDIQRDKCNRIAPFVCKVDANYAIYDSRCGVYGQNYEYFPNVSSCYKIPEIAFSWDQAYAECRAQGSHLVVLNSQLEKNLVKKFIKANPPVPGATVPWFHYVGIRAEIPKNGSSVVFKTIFNQTLEEAGFNEWSSGEPNNYLGTEYCVTILKSNGKYNDIKCSNYYGFVCEKEVSNNINK